MSNDGYNTKYMIISRSGIVLEYRVTMERAKEILIKFARKGISCQAVPISRYHSYKKPDRDMTMG